MTTWIVFRLLKFLALAGLAAGTGLGVGAARQEDRANAAFQLAAPALWATLVAGFLLSRTTHRSLGDPFIGLAVLASLLGLHGVVLCATRPAPRPISRWLGLAGLGVAVVLMVTRDTSAAVMAAASVLAMAGAAAVVLALPPADGAPFADLPQRAREWFVIVARLEGLSLLAMVGVAMPLRAATGLSLDGGTGVLGWGHGMLFVLYLQALQVASRTLGWSPGTIGVAFVSSLLPFGSFAFEWAHLRPGRRT